MSLRTFHIVFVGFSTLLAFVLGGWAFHFHRASGLSAYLALGGASCAGGVGLIVYGFWFWRKIRRDEEERQGRRRSFHVVPLLALLMMLGAPRVAHACSVCYGEAQGPMIDAARLGVWLLFGLVLSMQLAFGLFFVQLRRRAKAHQQTLRNESRDS